MPLYQHFFSVPPSFGLYWHTVRVPADSLHADRDGCPVVVGMAHNFTQDILVCNKPLPCPDHPEARDE